MCSGGLPARCVIRPVQRPVPDPADYVKNRNSYVSPHFHGRVNDVSDQQFQDDRTLMTLFYGAFIERLLICW